MESYEDWGCSDEVLQIRLSEVLDPWFPALTACLEPVACDEARKAYLRSLENLYYGTPAEEDFRHELKRRVEAALAGGPDACRQVMTDYRNIQEMGRLNGFIQELAKTVLASQEPLSEEKKREVENAKRRVQELAAALAGSAGSPFPMYNPYVIRRLRSECTVECEFLLGRTRFLSLRLGQEWERLRRKTQT